MRFRKLRIAFSVLCGVACLLLVVLWVVSYWREIVVYRYAGGGCYTGWSRKGGMLLIHQFRGGAGGGIKVLMASDSIPSIEVPQYSLLGFRYVEAAFGTLLFVPNWCPVCLSLLLAVAPWFSMPRRFSLRALLIATTVVAVLLGLIVASNR